MNEHFSKAFKFGIAYVAFNLFGLAETWYFGWDLFSGPPAEWVCDLIASIGQFVCLFFAVKEWSIYLIESTTQDVMRIFDKKRKKH